MSSNLEIQKVCMFCGKDFVARKTTTKTCSDNCAKRLYKLRKRGEAVQTANTETIKLKLQPIEDLKVKEFLTVPDAAKLLNCSTRTLYRLIDTKQIKAVNIAERKTLIKRTDIDKLFV